MQLSYLSRRWPMPSAFSFIILCFVSASVLAKGVYLTEEEYLQQAFPGTAVEKQQYYPSKTDKQVAKEILGHVFKGFRLRYWQHQQRTAWILEEIGKDLPITMGIVVENNRIERVRILTFRESRGWEVKYPSFTKQFIDAQLDEQRELTNKIDGVSGATLSVSAVRRVSRLALYFHEQAIKKHAN